MSRLEEPLFDNIKLIEEFSAEILAARTPEIRKELGQILTDDQRFAKFVADPETHKLLRSFALAGFLRALRVVTVQEG